MPTTSTQTEPQEERLEKEVELTAEEVKEFKKKLLENLDLNKLEFFTIGNLTSKK